VAGLSYSRPSQALLSAQSQEPRRGRGNEPGAFYTTWQVEWGRNGQWGLAQVCGGVTVTQETAPVVGRVKASLGMHVGSWHADVGRDRARVVSELLPVERGDAPQRWVCTHSSTAGTALRPGQAGGGYCTRGFVAGTRDYGNTLGIGEPMLTRYPRCMISEDYVRRKCDSMHSNEQAGETHVGICVKYTRVVLLQITY